MRINIAMDTVDENYLCEEAEKFETREATTPYLIMSSKTFHALEKVAADRIYVENNKGMEFEEYKILINNDLHYGDVDIR